ncbi:hypothetical protein [Sphaerotilus mobilis]|uniref:hypothetical protein n=1 Tax=Sphaerotilus mobilis TaxID=47994 RepID=UPI00102BECC3|nr:hypothetical protein [Sphaerotilus mobilis]
MEIIKVSLKGNETKTYMKAGRYFEIIGSTHDEISEVNVTFYGADGQITDVWKNAKAGIFAELEYSSFQITCGVNYTELSVLVMERGRGGTRRMAGQVTVDSGNITTTDQHKIKVTNGQIVYVCQESGAQRVSGKNLVFLQQETGNLAAIEYIEIQSDQAGIFSLYVTKKKIGGTGFKYGISSTNSTAATLVAMAGTEVDSNLYPSDFVGPLPSGGRYVHEKIANYYLAEKQLIRIECEISLSTCLLVVAENGQKFTVNAKAWFS